MDAMNNEKTISFCTKCGAALPADGQFCTNCGAVIANPAPADPRPAFTPVKEDAPAFAPVAEEPVAFAPAEDTPAFAPAEDAPAFTPAEEPVEAPAFTPEAAPAQRSAYIQPTSAFAEGLPEWDIEPPQILVRRR